MQTEWSSGRDDEPKGDSPPPSSQSHVVATPPIAPATDVEAVAVSTVVDGGAALVGGVPSVDDEVTGSPASTGAALDSQEEAHRSAVDAVDGLLDEVELALQRLDDGTYGRCEACGAAIDDAALEARPLVRGCTSCGVGMQPTGPC